MILFCIERFQEQNDIFDVIIAFEGRVFDAIIEGGITFSFTFFFILIDGLSFHFPLPFLSALATQ